MFLCYFRLDFYKANLLYILYCTQCLAYFSFNNNSERLAYNRLYLSISFLPSTVALALGLYALEDCRTKRLHIINLDSWMAQPKV